MSHDSCVNKRFDTVFKQEPCVNSFLLFDVVFKQESSVNYYFLRFVAVFIQEPFVNYYFQIFGAVFIQEPFVNYCYLRFATFSWFPTVFSPQSVNFLVHLVISVSKTGKIFKRGFNKIKGGSQIPRIHFTYCPLSL